MAATGTPTPNIGLRIPQGTDPASVDDINYNSNLLDTKLGAVGNDSVQDQIDSLNSKTANQMSHIDLANGTFNGSILTALAGLNNGDMKMYLNTNNPSDKPDDNHKWGPLLLCRISQQRGFVLYFDSAAGTKIGYSVDMSTLVWT